MYIVNTLRNFSKQSRFTSLKVEIGVQSYKFHNTVLSSVALILYVSINPSLANIHNAVLNTHSISILPFPLFISSTHPSAAHPNHHAPLSPPAAATPNSYQTSPHPSARCSRSSSVPECPPRTRRRSRRPRTRRSPCWHRWNSNPRVQGVRQGGAGWIGAPR